MLACACFDEVPSGNAEDATSLEPAPTTTSPDESSSAADEVGDSSSSGPPILPGGVDESSTGASGSVCGDGIVEDGESCDDENQLAGDGCTLCQVSGTPQWIFTDGTDAPAEAASAVALASPAGIVVVGALATDGADTDVWLEVLDDDGVSQLRRVVAGEGDGDDVAYDVRVRENGDISVVGEISTPVSFTDLWVGRYDGSGSLIDQSQAGSTIGSDGARAVALLAGDQLAIAGRIGFAAANDDAWLGRFVEGELSEAVSCDCGAQGHAASIVADGDGRVRATWQNGLAWQLVGFDAPLSAALPLPSWVVPLEGLLGPAFIDVGDDGGISLCGTVAAGNDDALSLQTFSPDGAPQLGITYDVGDGDQRCTAILTSGNVATMVGEIRGNLDDARGLVVSVERTNGAVRYDSELVIDDADETVINDIVIDSEGRTFVVGAFSSGGGDFDAFAARLVP
ncbi:MAG: DUF4215 domain-containing protein [Deltaproteobacteria bacterium]|nr:DUF4215 domain-containing protein [Nannocystaceae bacterium]